MREEISNSGFSGIRIRWVGILCELYASCIAEQVFLLKYLCLFLYLFFLFKKKSKHQSSMGFLGSVKGPPTWLHYRMVSIASRVMMEFNMLPSFHVAFPNFALLHSTRGSPKGSPDFETFFAIELKWLNLIRITGPSFDSIELGSFSVFLLMFILPPRKEF